MERKQLTWLLHLSLNTCLFREHAAALLVLLSSSRFVLRRELLADMCMALSVWEIQIWLGVVYCLIFSIRGRQDYQNRPLRDKFVSPRSHLRTLCPPKESSYHHTSAFSYCLLSQLSWLSSKYRSTRVTSCSKHCSMRVVAFSKYCLASGTAFLFLKCNFSIFVLFPALTHFRYIWLWTSYLTAQGIMMVMSCVCVFVTLCL